MLTRFKALLVKQETIRLYSLWALILVLSAIVTISAAGCGYVPSHWFTTSSEKMAFQNVYLHMQVIHDKVQKDSREQLPKKVVQDITKACLECMDTAKPLIVGE